MVEQGKYRLHEEESLGGDMILPLFNAEASNAKSSMHKHVINPIQPLPSQILHKYP